MGKSPRTTRRAKRWVRPVRVVETSIGDLPVLTLQDPSDVQGVVVFDCRPPLLPVSLDLSGIGLLSGLPPVASASVGVPPNEHGLSISGGGDSDVLIISELGVAPLEDSGTDLEDELPTPDGLLSTDASKPVLGPTSPGVDLELVRASLSCLTGDGDANCQPGGGYIRDASVVPRAGGGGVM